MFSTYTSGGTRNLAGAKLRIPFTPASTSVSATFCASEAGTVMIATRISRSDTIREISVSW